MQRNEMLIALSRSNVLIKDLSNFSCIEEVFDRQKSKIDLKEIDNDLKYLEKNNINLVSYFDEDYPENLRNIDYPPLMLYIKGLFRTEKLFFAIVGTRYPSGYGEKCASFFTKELTLSGFSIVSGLAKGIDKIAHKVCLQNDGYTIGVLGCGIDVTYPKENEALFDQIAISGALISEFALNTPPNAYNFPRRNRIITGLSEGLLVVEADIKSGSLVSAKLAQEQAKPVFAIPGEIFSKRSFGTNQLIKDGAFLAAQPQDVIFYYYKELKGKLSDYNSDEVRKIDLSEIEKKIYGCIEAETSINDIVEKIKLPIEEVSSVLFDLEMKGVIKRTLLDKVCKV